MLHRILWVALALVLIGFSIPPINNHFHGGSNKDYPMWFATGQGVLHGESPYPAQRDAAFPFMYPPACAAILALLSIPGHLPFIIILVMFCNISWILCALLCVYFAAGSWWKQQWLLYLVPNLFCVGYAWGIYLLGQPILFLLACMLGALWGLQRRRPVLTGALIALAAAIKAFPILALGYLIYRRQWTAAASCVVCLGLLLLALPACFRGPAGAVHDLRVWTDGMLLKYDENGIAQRAERGATWRNGSLVSVANRLMRPVIADHWKDDAEPFCVNVVAASFRTVNVILAAAALGLCGFYLYVMPRRAARTRETDMVEYAMMLILVILFTPLSFTYLNFWALFPLTLVFQFIIDDRNPPRARWISLGALLAVLALTLISIPATSWMIYLRAMGNTCAANLVLFFVLGYQMRVIRRVRRAAPARVASLRTTSNAVAHSG